jgi:hypothetical protein
MWAEDVLGVPWSILTTDLSDERFGDLKTLLVSIQFPNRLGWARAVDLQERLSEEFSVFQERGILVIKQK